MPKDFKNFKFSRFFESPIMYNGRGLFLGEGNRKSFKKIAIDVRNFILSKDFFLSSIVKEEGIWDMKTDEEKIFACQQFVKKHIRYVGDKKSMGLNEFWMFPNETLAIGKGDCFAGYEEIYTKSGLKAIKDIKVGNLVLSYDFEQKDYVYKPVIKAWEKGELQVNRIHFRNGQWIDVSENHPMWCRYHQKYSAYRKQYLSDIDISRWWERKVPIAKKIPYEVKDVDWLTEDLCVVLGHFLAEGWIKPNKTITSIACSSGKELEKYIKPILDKHNIEYKEWTNNSNVNCIKFAHSDFNAFLCKQLDNSFDIHMEEWLFHLPENKLKKIMYGYWLGDGTKNVGVGDKRGFQSNKETVYSTSSKQFAEDMQRMGLQTGQSFHVWKQDRHGGVGTKPIYRITKNPASHFLKDYGFKDISEVSIAKVEKLMHVKMYDLTVADTHTVVMKNGIITHQCEDGAILIASLARNAGVPAYKLKVCAGWVTAGENAPLGGHAYTIFKASDNTWKVMDWCYLANNLPTLQRPAMHNDPHYKEIWFSFNDLNSWSNKQKTISIEKTVKITKDAE